MCLKTNFIQNFRFLFKTLFFILCFTLCLYQIWKICEMYFSYKTIISVNYENNSIISLPAITFCFTKYLMVKEEYLKNQILNSSKDDENEHQIKVLKFINKMTSLEQLNVMYTKDDVFNKSCQILKRNVSQNEELFTNCEQLSDVKQSISYFETCFTFFHQNHSQDNVMFEIPANSFIDANHIIKVMVNKRLHSFQMSWHPRVEPLLRIKMENSIRVSYEKGIKFIFQYSKQVVTALPKPYDTNCFDYNTIRFNSREDCTQNCRVNQMLHLFDGFPGEYLSYDLRANQNFYDNYDKYEENPKLDQIIGDKCKLQCDFGTECVRERFEFKQTKFPTRDRRIKMLFSITDTPNISVKHLPKISFEEFICFVGSLISLYFGFSVINCFDLCLKFTEYLPLKPRVQNPDNNITHPPKILFKKYQPHFIRKCTRSASLSRKRIHLGLLR